MPSRIKSTRIGNSVFNKYACISLVFSIKNWPQVCFMGYIDWMNKDRIYNIIRKDDV